MAERTCLQKTLCESICVQYISPWNNFDEPLDSESVVQYSYSSEIFFPFLVLCLELASLYALVHIIFLNIFSVRASPTDLSQKYFSETAAADRKSFATYSLRSFL